MRSNPSFKKNSPSSSLNHVWRRRFAQLLCYSTLFLVFVGGMVKSTDSGLSVPDWPLSYGTFFPPMIGGVFYEHGHRMVAATVGLMTLILAIWLGMTEHRKWVKILGFVALGAVIAQGILGGLTVLFFLPDPISISHAILAQTFFILTILIAYSQSFERETRESAGLQTLHAFFLKACLVFIVIVYSQLILGAWMRHTESGLAIPDFPKMGGYWVPPFNETMLARINDWRFQHNLPLVVMDQVVIHFFHRLMALIIIIILCFLNFIGLKYDQSQKVIIPNIYLLNILVLLQVILGIFTVLSEKSPLTTSAHVMIGAGILGISVLLFLRAAPLEIKQLKSIF